MHMTYTNLNTCSLLFIFVCMQNVCAHILPRLIFVLNNRVDEGYTKERTLFQCSLRWALFSVISLVVSSHLLGRLSLSLSLSLSFPTCQLRLSRFQQRCNFFSFPSSCPFGISDEILDFALKNSFRRNSIIGDQFGRNWLLNVCPNKVRKNVGGIGRDFGGITRTQLWSQISTAHENPISAESKIVGNFLFSAEIIESGDSCAEM